MQCPACRRDVPESSRFCLACGARVDSSQAPTLTAAAGSPPSSDALDGAQFIPGTMLAGRYRIVGLLGRGGMGEVYRAEDLKLGQPVALKFLSKEVTDHADRLARFHQEVRLARQVSHPNVCRVHDIAETGGQHFLSMEYIDGEDLASLLRRIGRLPSDKALELCTAAVRRPRGGARPQGLASRSEARERADRRTGSGAPRGLWSRESHRPAARNARSCRHARLHGAGAAGRARGDDADRCVRAGSRVVRNVHGQACAHRRRRPSWRARAERRASGQPVDPHSRSGSGHRTRHPALSRTRSGSASGLGDRRRGCIARREPARGDAGGRRNTVTRPGCGGWRSRARYRPRSAPSVLPAC